MSAPTLWRQGDYVVSTDRDRLDRAAMLSFLAERSYWARGLTADRLDRRIANSLCFGLYHEPTGRQAGFARCITDGDTFAYLCDVFVLEEFRGAGLGVWLVDCVMAHPDIAPLRRVTLFTRDAHSLYERFGFVPPDERALTTFMLRFRPRLEETIP